MTDPVRQMRLVVTAADYDEAVAFYRDVLGLRQEAAFAAAGGRVTILDAGRATLEITDPIHAAYIDEVEVGRRVAGHIRVAFEVGDAVAMTARLVRGRRGRHRAPDRDAMAVAERTPRGSRFAAADDVPGAGPGARLTPRVVRGRGGGSNVAFKPIGRGDSPHVPSRQSQLIGSARGPAVGSGSAGVSRTRMFPSSSGVA